MVAGFHRERRRDVQRIFRGLSGCVAAVEEELVGLLLLLLGKLKLELLLLLLETGQLLLALLVLLELNSPLQSLPEAENVVLCHTEIPLEDSQELALDAAHIPLAKDAGAERPVDVLESRVVGVLGGNDKGSKEDSLEGPLLEGDVEVWAGAVDVDEGEEESGGDDLGAGDDRRRERAEFLLHGRAGT